MFMNSLNKNKHMSLSDRQIIEKGIFNESSKTAIAEIIGKDASTVGKEIKEHRYQYYKCPYTIDCINYPKCKYDRKCSTECIGYQKFKCKRRDRSPGACNGCEKYKSCRFDKYKYDALTADGDYKRNLSCSREGFNTTTEEVKRIGNIMMPLLKNGQSIDQILLSHPEIKLSNKTLYSYIENNLFKSVGIDITVMDLRRQVSRRLPKSRKNLYKPRQDNSFLEGRKYKDYQNYIFEYPDSKIVQMDTVYNDIGNGPFIQTFKFIRYGFLFCLYHKEKTKESMNDGVLLLEKILGEELFNQEVEVLLTDRGCEFYGVSDLEVREDGTIRTRVFYCDAMASYQKGSLENKHEELRYVCPKEVDLYKLGLTSQEKMDLVTSHVNSSPRKKLEGKSPIELMKFLRPEVMQKLFDFGINEIEKDKVILRPFLLKDNH